MQTMSTTTAARSIGETVFKAQRGPIELTRHGKAAVVIVSADDWIKLGIAAVFPAGATGWLSGQCTECGEMGRGNCAACF